MGILDGKVALVTRASKGVGAGIAMGLAAAGARALGVRPRERSRSGSLRRLAVTTCLIRRRSGTTIPWSPRVQSRQRPGRRGLRWQGAFVHDDRNDANVGHRLHA
jgi:NAD(P)-dependent dehydrogenase (short-subunit alcohol dehydrogenase family)